MLHLEVFRNPRESLRALMDRLLPGIEPGTRVLVKPNWCARTPPLPPENTSPAFLSALLEWLEARGARVTVGHAALLTPPDRPYLGLSELIELARSSDLLERFPSVRFCDLETQPMELRRSGDIQMMLPRLLGEHDLLVDCARPKTHVMTGVSLGAKNLMGLAPDSEKLRMHRDGLHRFVAALADMAWPSITLLEADVGMEGEGPHHGTERRCGYYLGGDDLLEVDSVGCRLMGIDPAGVDHIAELARRRGRSLPPLPREMEPWVRPFRAPRAWITHGRRIRVWPGDSCSTCHVAARAVEAHASGQRGRLGEMATVASAKYLRGFNLYMGHQPAGRTPPDGELSLAVGECARPWAEAWGLPLLPGCPVCAAEVRPALLDFLRRRGSG